MLPDPSADFGWGVNAAARERAAWSIGFIALVTLIVGAMSLAKVLGYESLDGPRSPLVGHEAPALDLPVLGAEERVDVADLRGDVVLLDFWASWCNPCRQSIPALNEVHERYGTRIRMYGVNLDQGMSAADVRSAHRSFGAEFPSLLDPRGDAQMAYQVSSIPTLVVIDRQGVVRLVFHGVPDPQDVGDAIAELVGDG